MDLRFARVLGWTTLVVLVFWSTTATAVPRFAARTGSRCSLCHVNPTGGGPRSRYGRNVFEKQFLSFQWDKEMDVGADLEVGFGDSEFSAALGTDLRAAFLWSQPGGDVPGPAELNSFYLMQADLYVTAELTDYVTVALDKGQSRMEAWGMLNTPDRDYWLKLGQFVMPYGLRFPNHRIFVREQTGFNPAGDYRGLDTGIEAGAAVGPVNLIAAVGNGPPPGGTLEFDDNDSKAVYAKVEYIRGGDDLKFRLGLNAARNFSGRRQIRSEGGQRRLLEDNRVRTRQAGAYVATGLGRVTYLGEIDVFETKEYATDSTTFEESTETQAGYASFQELGYLVVQGVDIQALFEYHDPSLEYAGGTVTRAGGGFELFPLPMLEWKLVYRHTFAETSPRDGTNELFTYLHFFM